MNFKFIHTADIHLDSPLQGLQRYEGAPVEYIRAATREAFKNLIELSLSEEVSFVLIAGDLYDGDWKDYNAGLFFASQMARLNDAGIKVFIVRGNHDAASRITRQLRLPGNVTEFPADRAGTVLLEDLKVAVHGHSFARQSVTDNLSLGYPNPCSGYFNIGLLHTCANGRDGHESYAPCDVRYLETKGYAYWALGHVHNREIINEDPYIVFPGNTQGRNVRETGVKGCTVVEVSDGRVTSLEHRSLDVLRWVLCEIDITDAVDEEDILNTATENFEREEAEADGRLLAMRLVFRGPTKYQPFITRNPEQIENNIRARANEVAYDRLWVEKIKFKTKNKGDRKKILENHPVESLLRLIAEIPDDDEIIEDIKSELNDLKTALPPEFFSGDNIDFVDRGLISRILPEIEDLIITRLAGEIEEVAEGED